MPTFNSYTNGEGYYLRARPSDAGNVTYQTTPEADEFLMKLGYADNESIPWGVINPLRAAGLIYTDGQGIETEPDPQTPELDPSELATISSVEAEKLLSYLQSRGDIPDHVYDQLREIIERNKRDSADILSEVLESEFSSLINVQIERDDGASIDIEVTTRTEHIQDIQELKYILSVYTHDEEREYLVMNGWETCMTTTKPLTTEYVKEAFESQYKLVDVMESSDKLSIDWISPQRTRWFNFSHQV